MKILLSIVALLFAFCLTSCDKEEADSKEISKMELLCSKDWKFSGWSEKYFNGVSFGSESDKYQDLLPCLQKKEWDFNEDYTCIIDDKCFPEGSEYKYLSLLWDFGIDSTSILMGSREYFLKRLTKHDLMYYYHIEDYAGPGYKKVTYTFKR